MFHCGTYTESDRDAAKQCQWKVAPWQTIKAQAIDYRRKVYDIGCSVV